MSAPEAPGITLTVCSADIIELAAFRGGVRALTALAADRAVSLPAPGRIARTAEKAVLSVRPQRWLLVSPPAPPGTVTAQWQPGCAGIAAVLDLSCAQAVLHLAGPAARELLARGCRLDLDPQCFPSGSAAATVMAQVAVILCALPSGLLLLTPSTTARHLHEWLSSTAQPFGLRARSGVTVAAVYGASFA